MENHQIEEMEINTSGLLDNGRENLLFPSPFQPNQSWAPHTAVRYTNCTHNTLFTIS